MLIIFACATFLFTLFGGMFSFRFRDRFHLILGFSAGALVAVSLLDLLPEALELLSATGNSVNVFALAVLGFFAYMFLDRLFIGHGHSDERCADPKHHGALGASSLALHGFLDGLALGLAFKASVALGLSVSLAVLSHKFIDGINTVAMFTRDGGSRKGAFGWLFANAVVPILGIASSFFINASEGFIGILLALFGGFFLYVGASDLLPESHHEHPTRWTTFATLVGALVIFVIV